MRKTQGSVVCPECGRLVDVNEAACPNCGRWRPGLYGYSPLLQRVFGAVDVSHAILWSCVILYAGALALDPDGAWRNAGRGGFMGLLAPSSEALLQLGMTSGALVERYDLWWTPLSATYLHGGILHIFFNMMWLRMLGPQIEHVLGPGRFFVLYTAAGAGGFIVSNLVSGAPTVGASGAIFGLLAATIVLAREHGGEWGAQVGRQALMWAGMLFVFGLVSPSTNNWAHGGGFVAGFVGMRVLLAQSRRSEGPIMQLAALVAALATLGAVIASFIVVRSS